MATEKDTSIWWLPAVSIWQSGKYVSQNSLLCIVLARVGHKSSCVNFGQHKGSGSLMPWRLAQDVTHCCNSHTLSLFCCLLVWLWSWAHNLSSPKSRTRSLWISTVEGTNQLCCWRWRQGSSLRSWVLVYLALPGVTSRFSSRPLTLLRHLNQLLSWVGSSPLFHVT